MGYLAILDAVFESSTVVFIVFGGEVLINSGDVGCSVEVGAEIVDESFLDEGFGYFLFGFAVISRKAEHIHLESGTGIMQRLVTAFASEIVIVPLRVDQYWQIAADLDIENSLVEIPRLLKI